MILVNSFVTGGDGSFGNPWTGWDTGTPWAAGQLYQFDAGFYSFGSLAINVPCTLRGVGGSSLNSSPFGGGWLNSGSFGTVLMSSAISGSALTFDHPNNSYSYNLRDLMLLGPGVGTSIGVSLGSSRASVQNRWDNVYICNFFQGLAFNSVMDSTFTHIRTNGCVTGGVIGLNSNQNVWDNLQAQHGTIGFQFQQCSQNVINGGLSQNVATGFNICAAANISLSGIYGEGFANLFQIDSSLGGVKNCTIRDVYASGAPNLVNFVGASTVNYFTLENVTWGGSMTIPHNVINANIRNVEASFTSIPLGILTSLSG